MQGTLPLPDQLRRFAAEWIAAWNAHDLDGILAHYAHDVVLTSPVAARLLGDLSGNVSGIDALRNYFARGLQAYPSLRFELIDVFYGLTSLVLVYTNQNGSRTAEFMEFNESGRVARVVAHCSA